MIRNARCGTFWPRVSGNPLDAGRGVLAGPPDEVVTQTPGRIVEVEQPSNRARAWRRGRVFHEWLPDESPAGTPDLEDAIIVEMLSL